MPIPAPGPPAVEQALADALRRAMRSPSGRVMVALCLSVLAPPAPRPHHRRVAAAVMADAAARNEGRVFTLGNGDIVLLCRAAIPDSFVPTVFGAEPDAEPASGPLALPGLLAKLFRLDLPPRGELVRLWHLDEDPKGVTCWCAAQLARPSAPAPVRAAAQPVPAASGDPIAELDALLVRGLPADLLGRRHAVRLVGGADRNAPLLPLFREVAFSQEVLDTLVPDLAACRADPYRDRYLAARADRCLIQALTAELQDGGGTLAGPADGPPLHLVLTAEGVLSPGFARLAAACAASGHAVGVELSLAEAADPDRFAKARAVVREAGMALVLGGVSDVAARLFRPEQLGADLIKLDWSPRTLMGDAAADRELDGAVARIGPEKLVLCAVDTDAALAWGFARGIRRFHGQYAEAMLAASRLTVCAYAAGCTLRQCTQRALATGPAPRAWCHDHTLLDGTAGAAARARPRLASVA